MFYVDPSSSYIVSTIQDMRSLTILSISTSGAIWPTSCLDFLLWFRAKVLRMIPMWHSERTLKALVQIGASSTRRHQPLVSDDEGKFVDPSDTTPLSINIYSSPSPTSTSSSAPAGQRLNSRLNSVQRLRPAIDGGYPVGLELSV